MVSGEIVLVDNLFTAWAPTENIFPAIPKAWIHIYFQIFCLFFTTMLYKLLKREYHGLSPRKYFINILKLYSSTESCSCIYASSSTKARRGGAEVAGWTLDRKVRVRFPAYAHRVWALWWQGGKRRLWTSRCPCRGGLGTLKTPSCPWRGCPAAGQNVETGHLSRHNTAEISLNVTLNHNQQQQQFYTSFYMFYLILAMSKPEYQFSC